MPLTDFQINDDAKESDGYKPFKKNYYPVFVEESDEQPNAKKTGRWVKVKLKVTDGEFKGRVVFDYMNYENDNEEVAQRDADRLSLLCKACGVKAFRREEDVNLLMDKLIEARIETFIKKDGTQENKVWSYRPRQSTAQGDLYANPNARVNQRASQQAQPPTDAGFDDDIPF